MLTLPTKKKWFDMELSGEKPEEYREIKPYWTTRFLKWLGFEKGEENKMLTMIKHGYFTKPRKIKFQNGYSANAPYFITMCTPQIGTGKEEWGAEAGKEYYVLKIHEIIEKKNC
ncbi:MAG: ASCH domain-containing protein [Lachnospiraceae bacterium]|nr:ASCH domain-containing protein [Lachnospiraceae bacterium]